MGTATPRARIDAACRRMGQAAVVDRCVAVFGGDLGDEPFLRVLGGDHADRLLSRGMPMSQVYWTRVWAMRGLLWAWDGRPTDVLIASTSDPIWRVREMGAKVVARHALGDLMTAMEGLLADPVPRVRSAAERAIVAVASTGA